MSIKLTEITVDDIQKYIKKSPNDKKADPIITNKLYILIGRLFGFIGAIQVKNGDRWRTIYVNPKKIEQLLRNANPDFIKKRNKKEFIKKFIFLVKKSNSSISEQKQKTVSPELAPSVKKTNLVQQPNSPSLSPLQEFRGTQLSIVKPNKEPKLCSSPILQVPNNIQNFRNIAGSLSAISANGLDFISTVMKFVQNNSFSYLFNVRSSKKQYELHLALQQQRETKLSGKILNTTQNLNRIDGLLSTVSKTGLDLVCTAIKFVENNSLSYLFNVRSSKKQHELHSALQQRTRIKYSSNRKVANIKQPGSQAITSVKYFANNVFKGAMHLCILQTSRKQNQFYVALKPDRTSSITNTNTAYILLSGVLSRSGKISTMAIQVVEGIGNRVLSEVFKITLNRSKKQQNLYLKTKKVPDKRFTINTVKNQERESVLHAIRSEATNERYANFIKKIQENEVDQLFIEEDFSQAIDIAEISDAHYISNINEEKFINNQRKQIERAFIIRDLKKNKVPISKTIIDDIELYLSSNNTVNIDTKLQEAIIRIKKTIPNPPDNLQESYNILCKKIYALHKKIIDKKISNKEILSQLRLCEQNSAYQFLKWDESIAAIHYLHGISIASFLDVDQMTYFGNLSAALIDVHQKPNNLSTQLIDALKSAVQKGVAKNDKTLSYACSFPVQIAGAFLSSAFGTRIANLFSTQQYEPRGFLENNPGRFITIEEKDSQKKSHFIHTPTPTNGNTIAEEKRLEIQAIENRYILFITNKKNSENIAHPNLIHWNYINLQNIDSKDEGERSGAIMKLQEEYPTVFSAVTISHDSPFYLDGMDHSISAVNSYSVISAMQKKSGTTLNNEYKKQMKEELLDKSNFSLTERSKKTGYYFPEIANWQDVVDGIVDKAYSLCENIQNSDSEKDDETFAWEKKAAFRELVTIGISCFFQKRAKNELPIAGESIYNTSCKECIDRGGKLTAGVIYALTENEEEAKKRVLDSFMSRAILSRFRTPLFHRIQPLISLIALISHQEIYNFILSIEPFAQKKEI